MNFLNIEDVKQSVLDAYFAATQNAEDSADAEFEAAMRIQAVWRGYKARSMIAVWHFAASEIQRVFRGFSSRHVYTRMVETKKHQERLEFFNTNAVAIQRVFRGWLSRRRILDFRKRAVYLTQLTARNEDMRRALVDYEATTAGEVERLETEKQTQHFTALASKLHHLVSTKAIPGVYNPPHDDLVPTVGDVPVEAFIDELGRLHATQRVQELHASMR